jgi:heme-degrading monooxygenase HmoA
MVTRRLRSFSSEIQSMLSNRRRLLKSFGWGAAGFVLFEGQFKRLLGETREASVQLHIYIEVKPGKGSELETLYHSSYIPAIKVQDGFLGSRLLRHYESKSKYEIDISFRTEKQRAAWAQSKEHQAAWPTIQEISDKITWQGFDVLA